MDQPDIVEYVVVADRHSSDVVDLYPSDGPSVGSSSVSIPLRFDPSTQGGVRVHIGSPRHHDHILWLGPLDLRSGAVLISDWSMRPLRELSLPGGSYQVVVAQDQGLSITFTSL